MLLAWLPVALSTPALELDLVVHALPPPSAPAALVPAVSPQLLHGGDVLIGPSLLEGRNTLQTWRLYPVPDSAAAVGRTVQDPVSER